MGPHPPCGSTRVNWYGVSCSLGKIYQMFLFFSLFSKNFDIYFFGFQFSDIFCELTHRSLKHNHLEGTIPPSIFTDITTLEYLYTFFFTSFSSVLFYSSISNSSGLELKACQDNFIDCNLIENFPIIHYQELSPLKLGGWISCLISPDFLSFFLHSLFFTLLPPSDSLLTIYLLEKFLIPSLLNQDQVHNCLHLISLSLFSKLQKQMIFCEFFSQEFRSKPLEWTSSPIIVCCCREWLS